MDVWKTAGEENVSSCSSVVVEARLSGCFANYKLWLYQPMQAIYKYEVLLLVLAQSLWHLRPLLDTSQSR